MKQWQRYGLFFLFLSQASPIWAKLGDPTATGESKVTINGEQTTFGLQDGFNSETDFKNPQKAIIVFAQQGSPENSNPRRFKLTINSRKSGTVTAQPPSGNPTMPRLRYIAKGGQHYELAKPCDIRIITVYTWGNTIFKGEFNDCVFKSTEIIKTVSAKFHMERKPYRNK